MKYKRAERDAKYTLDNMSAITTSPTVHEVSIVEKLISLFLSSRNSNNPVASKRATRQEVDFLLHDFNGIRRCSSNNSRSGNSRGDENNNSRALKCTYICLNTLRCIHLTGRVGNPIVDTGHINVLRRDSDGLFIMKYEWDVIHRKYTGTFGFSAT